MRRSGRARAGSLAVLVVWLLLFGTAGSAAASDRQIGIVRNGVAFSLRAYGGAVVWLDDGLGHSGYRVWQGGRGRALPIDPSPGVLGLVDLGPAGHGGLVAIYERCQGSDESGFYGCDIYRYAFRTHCITPVPGAVTPDVEERSPSTWRGHDAFVRGDYLYKAKPSGILIRSPLVRLAPLWPGVSYYGGDTGTDLKRNVITWEESGDDGEHNGIEVKRFDWRGRGRRCEVATGRFSRSSTAAVLTSVGDPQLDGRYVYWSQVDYLTPRRGSPPTVTASVRRRRLPTKNCERRGAVEQALVRTHQYSISDYWQRFAVSDGRLFYVLNYVHHSGNAAIYEARHVSFRPVHGR